MMYTSTTIASRARYAPAAPAGAVCPASSGYDPTHVPAPMVGVDSAAAQPVPADCYGWAAAVTARYGVGSPQADLAAEAYREQVWAELDAMAAALAALEPIETVQYIDYATGEIVRVSRAEADAILPAELADDDDALDLSPAAPAPIADVPLARLVGIARKAVRGDLSPAARLEAREAYGACYVGLEAAARASVDRMRRRHLRRAAARPALTPADAAALAAVAQAVAYRRAAARRDKAMSRYLEAPPERRAVMSDLHSRHASRVYRMAEQMSPAAWSVVFAGEALPHVTLETIRPYMHGRSVA